MIYKMSEPFVTGASPVMPVIKRLHNPLFDEKKLEVFLLHDIAGPVELHGNKWYKLKYNLEQAAETGHNTLLTFGGAYSNHIAATAYAAKMFGFKSIGIIR